MMHQKWVKNGDPPVPFCPTTKIGFLKEDCEMTPMTANLLRPQRPISGCWWTPTCWSSGIERLSQSATRMKQGNCCHSLAGTICVGDHEDEAKGIQRPWLGEITKGKQRGHETSP